MAQFTIDAPPAENGYRNRPQGAGHKHRATEAPDAPAGCSVRLFAGGHARIAASRFSHGGRKRPSQTLNPAAILTDHPLAPTLQTNMRALVCIPHVTPFRRKVCALRTKCQSTHPCRWRDCVYTSPALDRPTDPHSRVYRRRLR